MKRKDIINIFLPTSIFLLIGIMVRSGSEAILFDSIILDFIHSSSNPMVTGIMKTISFIGSAYFLIPFMTLVSLILIYKRSYYGLKLLILSSLGSYLLNIGLKFIFNRSRPFDYFLVEQGGLSYPSGHSMVTMAFYMTIVHLLDKNIRDKKQGRTLKIIAILMIGLMGLSRLYLGVHWPTDIIGGYLMGYVFYYIITRYIK